MSSVCIAYANGCPRSRMDAALLFSYFKANGWQVKQNLKEADMVLVSTCGVNQRSERKSIRLVSIANKKRKADSKLVVIGCLAGINAKDLVEKFHAILIPPVHLGSFDHIINAKVKLSEVRDLNYIQPVIGEAQKCFNVFDRVISEFEASKIFMHRVIDYLKPIKNRSFRNSAFQIRIAKGCLGRCSYCAIKLAAGPLVSKPMEDILAEFDTGIRNKFKDFVIVAGDVGSYGQDIHTNIVELLRNLFNRKGTYRLHLTEFNPRWLIQYQSELMGIFRTYANKISTVIFPIQSGSERILKLMQRDYTAAKTKQCLTEIRGASPQIQVFTHVIVGFPGETENDFNDTMLFLREVHFDEIAVYKYEGRPNIEAEQIKNKVPESIKDMRLCRLLREFRKTAKVAL